MNANEMELISGTIVAVVYQNPENGYAVLKLDSDEGMTVTVVGTVPMAAVGERLIVTGKWNTHASYGRQFEAEFLERLMPQAKTEILAFLSSRAIKFVGPVTAARIVERFGEDTLNILENQPERLAEVVRISPAKALEIGHSYQKTVGVRRLVEYLSAYHIPAELAVRLYRLYGDNAMQILQENPYCLTEGDFNADFALVDAFALENGMAGDDTRRIEAGILFELRYNLNNGHTFLPYDKLVAATATLLQLPIEPVAAAAEQLHQTGRVETDMVAGLRATYLPEYYEAEHYLTHRFLQMAASQEQTPPDLGHTIDSIERHLGISYAAQQRLALEMAAEHQIMILTGGPGTGKTTSLAGILELFDAMKLKTQLAAPTGRAAKRLSELTGREALTIHRLLEAQISPENGMMYFARNEQEPLRCSAMIVDETSMVDLLLMHSLLRALKPGCKLILVGDPDQLPSVGAGNVFSDLIRSKRIVTVRLTEIFRQAQESLIVMNAHAVNHSQMPQLGVKNKDFFFLRQHDGQKAVELIQSLCKTRLPKNMGIAVSDIQVLSPTRKGVTGTANLNRELQRVLNPPAPEKKERQCGNFSFREGDRVMQIRNNYDIIWTRHDGLGMGTGIFNGDIGVIRQIDFREETVQIDFDDREVSYPFDLLTELEPAYAMTVHKSQGSEYRAVILSVSGGSPYLLTRSILYTAITRARELLILVGDENVIATMVCNDRRQKRYSGLKLRLEKGE